MYIKYCYICEEYYKEHPKLQQILDVNDVSKHNIRTHLCLNVKYNTYNILIPLRKSLGDAERIFGTIGFSVPSQSKPNAGLDYRYIMIINDKKYIRYDKPRIPNSQQAIIEENYKIIEKQAINYIKMYIKQAKKGRAKDKALFRASSLVNFHKELGIDDSKIPHALIIGGKRVVVKAVNQSTGQLEDKVLTVNSSTALQEVAATSAPS